ncbi:uncharacterized protein LOC128214457 [Mya arenaria]|uniref:uncharacterized protein LOC128214457 n=1 Tax=Mya arenaria TaxID=6604 RepID=UPI0022E2DFE9|nr:uncharacterized protein LOC128214457 [Mya arenaria]
MGQNMGKVRNAMHCGYEGHIKTDPKCPAKGKKCRKCKKENHFEKCCKSKPFGKPNQSRREKIRAVDIDENDSSDDYVFNVSSQYMKGDIHVDIGGITIPVIIDSGATVNIIDRKMWEYMKERKVKCNSKLTNKKVYAYGNDKPLTVAGSFTADVTVSNKTVNAEFIVVEENGQALLGKTTAVELDILHIEMPSMVNNVMTDVERKQDLSKKFPKCFHGIGKLKDYQLHIPLIMTLNQLYSH